MNWTVGSLAAALVVLVAGCGQTDPSSVCKHIATLQHGAEAAKSIREYERLCVAPMTQARLNRPQEYGCWSKCIVGVSSWTDSVRCDGCVGSNQEFELFQLSKTRKKQADEQKLLLQKTAVPTSSARPPEGGSCGAQDAACEP